MSRGVSDKITYKPYNQSEQWLLPPSLDELVPQNHFVRIVSKTVDELKIEEVFARNTKGGRASRYNPVMLLKVLIYCYMTGTAIQRQMKTQLENVQKRLGCTFKFAIADAGYGSEENYDYLEKNEITGIVKYTTYEKAFH